MKIGNGFLALLFIGFLPAMEHTQTIIKPQEITYRKNTSFLEAFLSGKGIQLKKMDVEIADYKSTGTYTFTLKHFSDSLFDLTTKIALKCKEKSFPGMEQAKSKLNKSIELNEEDIFNLQLGCYAAFLHAADLQEIDVDEKDAIQTRRTLYNMAWASLDTKRIAKALQSKLYSDSLPFIPLLQKIKDKMENK